MNNNKHHKSRAKQSSLIANLNSEYLWAADNMHRSGLVLVYVEGYEDVAFWRNVLQKYETPTRKFEISTPIRQDLAKGKKVVLNFVPQAGSNLLLCIDSDFDYLFGKKTQQSRLVNSSKYVIQTYTYAIENYLCYPPSLRNIAVKATKNDAAIFDFEAFINDYSRTIYPLFIWYAYAAMLNEPDIFALSDFRNSVRINYVQIADNGSDTISYLQRQVDKRIHQLRSKNANHIPELESFETMIREKGVTPQTTHLYMQGHTLMENVVINLLNSVCEELRSHTVSKIMDSSRQGLSLRNELSYYNNSLRDITTLLTDNVGFTDCPLFSRIESDLQAVFTV